MQKRLSVMVIVVLASAVAGALALALLPDAGRLTTAEASQARPESGLVVPAFATSSAEGASDEVSMLVVGTALIGLGAVLRKAA